MTTKHIRWQIQYTHAPTKITYTVNNMRTGRPFTSLLDAQHAAAIMAQQPNAIDIHIVQPLGCTCGDSDVYDGYAECAVHL